MCVVFEVSFSVFELFGRIFITEFLRNQFFGFCTSAKISKITEISTSAKISIIIDKSISAKITEISISAKISTSAEFRTSSTNLVFVLNFLNFFVIPVLKFKVLFKI